MVTLPKGTYVQVVTWMRHRSKTLWGEDADLFNPNRNFRCTFGRMLPARASGIPAFILGN